VGCIRGQDLLRPLKYASSKAESGRMSYLVLRLRCMLHGHEWRETTGPTGMFQRCRNCYIER
jgi:hypothetical protein